MRYRANLIAVASLCCLAALAVAWGWFDAGGLRSDSPGHATAVITGAIGLLLGLPVLGSSLALNECARATCAAPEGRWLIGPAEIAGLLEWQRRNAVDNEWRPTAAERARGVAVCWAGEDLVVGGHYWRVAPGQYPRILSVRSRPAPPVSVTLRHEQAWVHNMASRLRLVGSGREFRFPAPDEAQAQALARHLSRLLGDGSAQDSRRRLLRLSNWAFAAAACFLVLLVFGFGVALHDQANGILRSPPERVALVAATVLGVLGAPTLLFVGGLIRIQLRR